MIIPLRAPISTRFVHPGQWYVGRGQRGLKTVLGSCVTVTFWHPGQRVGAMCHYMLPGAPRDRADDARYAEGALQILVQRLRGVGCEPGECRVELHGGGAWNTGQTIRYEEAVGARNVEEAWRLCRRYGLQVSAHDLGGHYYRTVHMNLADGTVRSARQRWCTPALGAGNEA